MAYQYSNPYQASSQVNTPPASRSTFGAAVGAAQGYQVLFGGLPLDVTDKDLRDLLINAPLQLAATSTTVKTLHDSQGRFSGSAIVSVSHADDAERIRSEYSGQNIDGTYRLTVQHVLPPTQPLPARSVAPFAPAPVAAVAQATPIAPAAPRAPRAVAVAPAAARATPARVAARAPAAPVSQRAPGMALLSRMRGSGGPSTQQAALLAKQKANLSKSASTASLMSRIAKGSAGLGSSSSPARKVVQQHQQARKASSSASARSARTKAAANKPSSNTAGGMEVDTPAKANGSAGAGAGNKGKGKAVKETPNQAALDEEMRLYERQKRFAA